MRPHLKRPCRVCDKIFLPTGKYEKLCQECKNFSTANKNFVMWIRKGQKFLQLEKYDINDKRYSKIKKELKELNKLIRLFLK